MKHFFLFFILNIFLFSSVKAKTGTLQELCREMAVDTVQGIIDQGIGRIGSLDLEKLAKDVDTVRWGGQDLVFFLGSGGRRYTAVYYAQDRRVLVNMLSLRNIIPHKIPLFSWALHESLGALGLEDEKYEQTSALRFLLTHKEIPLIDRVDIVEDIFEEEKTTPNFDDRIYTLVADEGGATVVGGGGDAVMLYFKEQLISYVAGKLSRKEVKLSDGKKILKKIFNLHMEFEQHNEGSYSWSGNYIPKITEKEGITYIDYIGSRDPKLILKDSYYEHFLDSLDISI